MGPVGSQVGTIGASSARSAHWPRAIRKVRTTDPPKDNEDDTSSPTSMILPHLRRWGCLHLVDVSHKIKRIVLDQVSAGRAPLLEEVQVLHSSDLNHPSKLSLPNTCPRWKARDLFSGRLPSLRSVEWSSPLPDRKALPPLKNLRNLTLGDGTLTDPTALPFILLIHQLLTDSPSLEYLRIQHIPSNGVYYPPSTNHECTQLQLSPLTHRSLRTLIVDSSPTLRSTVLRHLILPNLRTISNISHKHDVDLSVCESIARRNSLPSLRVVFIYENDPPVGSPANPNYLFLAPAIRNLDNLRVLTLRSIDFEGAESLSVFSSSCPQLRWLLFILCTGFTVPAVRGIVDRRIQAEGMNPLEVLCIYWINPEDKPTQDDVEWLSQRLLFKQQHHIISVLKHGL
ncbi:hypothetical protein FRB90_012337 [Tulasnella sp. 427]|nr:hypothetical protein FRB90_012337 [Tulasnella sp. 427]